MPVAYWRFEGLPWLKVAIDAWMTAAELTEGHVLRPVGRGDRVLGDRMKLASMHRPPQMDCSYEPAVRVRVNGAPLAATMKRPLAPG